MRRATQVKTAAARATIAAHLIKTVKHWPYGNGFGRDFDDCFEMGDGKQVVRILAQRAARDAELRQAMIREGLSTMLDNDAVPEPMLF